MIETHRSGGVCSPAPSPAASPSPKPTTDDKRGVIEDLKDIKEAVRDLGARMQSYENKSK